MAYLYARRRTRFRRPLVIVLVVQRPADEVAASVRHNVQTKVSFRPFGVAGRPDNTGDE